MYLERHSSDVPHFASLRFVLRTARFTLPNAPAHERGFKVSQRRRCRRSGERSGRREMQMGPTGTLLKPRWMGHFS